MMNMNYLSAISTHTTIKPLFPNDGLIGLWWYALPLLNQSINQSIQKWMNGWLQAPRQEIDSKQLN